MGIAEGRVLAAVFAGDFVGSLFVGFRGQFLEDAVEIRLEQTVLHDAVFLELAFGVGLCEFRRQGLLIYSD